MIYCLNCKKMTEDVNINPKVTKNKRPYITANCSICKRLKSKFVSINQIKGMVFFLIYSDQYQFLIEFFKDTQHRNHIEVLQFLYGDILNILYLKFV